MPETDPITSARSAVREGRYEEAASAVRPLAEAVPAARFTLNLAVNLAEIARHRPELLDRLGDPTELGPFRLIVGPTGHPTIAHVDGATARPLAPGGDPIAQLRKLAPRLSTDATKFNAVALAGVADGYAMQFLAQQDDGLLGMQQAVYVVEPDPQLLAACLHVLDHAGERGAIAQRRFAWLVGPDWLAQYETMLADDVLTQPAGAWLRQPPTPESVTDALKAAAALRDAAIRARGNDGPIDGFDGNGRYDATRLAALFGDRPPRRPRALLVTSRFTTVLRHSTADVARALDELGWETRTLIEVEPWQRLTPAAIADALDGFDPDLVFQIDHLRTGMPAWFPRDVPFVCWIQDQLSHLTTTDAGRSVGPRDFVLTGVGPMYTRLYGYPARQCIAMAKLTRVPARPDRWDRDGDDLAYVSNASRTAAEHRDELLATCGEGHELYAALAATCDEVVATYGRGETLSTLREVADVFRRCLAAERVAVANAADFHAVVRRLFEGLNNALYRQQALGWAASIAEREGLSLAIYGEGWDRHPTLAPYARGPIAYGEPLETTTRRARISLQVVPYWCLHQRLLDGLAAGGFFLVRRHPFDRMLPGLERFLAEHAGDAANVDQARGAATPGAFTPEIDRWLTAVDAGGPSYEMDPVEWVRGLRASGLLTGEGELLPRLGEVSFGGEAELNQRVTRFLNDPAAAAEIAERQRREVESRLTYAAGMRRVIAEVRDRLMDETAKRVEPAPMAEVA